MFNETVLPLAEMIFARNDMKLLTSDESRISINLTLDCRRPYLKSYETSVELIQRSSITARAYVI